MKNNFAKDILLGLTVGDALGVPVEFINRKQIADDPVTDMRGYGTHNQPAGAFSDDSSLAFCLAEALTGPFTVQKVADNSIAWLYDSYWTAHGTVFDIGNATRQAIFRLKRGVEPSLAGGMEEEDNGNGSLMRILPLLVLIHNKPVAERYRLTKEVSSVTHGHIRSVIACFYYLEFARLLLQGIEKRAAYQQLQLEIPGYLATLSINPAEIRLFDRLLTGAIDQLPEEQIHSSGYVLHTLEASVWCLLTTTNYKDAVLKAVNLGSDTDTTGAVAGGLAGLLYGAAAIPPGWLQQLARRSDIEDLARRMTDFMNN